MDLPQDKVNQYSAIIDDILASSDLATITRKRIRKELQARLDRDISEDKEQIQTLINERFDIAYAAAEKSGELSRDSSAENIPKSTPVAPSTALGSGTNGTPTPIKNGVAKDHDDYAKVHRGEFGVHKKGSELLKKSLGTPDRNDRKRAASLTPDGVSSTFSEPLDSPPPKKKHKKTISIDTDAALARRLQEEENGRARTTRGGGAKRKPVVKKEKKGKKSKSKTKVDSDDDSDLNDGSGSKREVNRNSGFHKPMTLSPNLSALLGETQLSRPQTVKRIWEYIKEHGLQDPNDRRQVICDGPMKTVFKVDKVHMFTMNKILGQNLYAIDE